MPGNERSNNGAKLPTDAGARFDKEVDIDASVLEPMITYGTNPGMVIPISSAIPTRANDAVFAKSLAYMGLEAGAPIKDQPVNVVFLGSCTNGRISDLRSAADVLRGRKVAKGVHMLVIPGSQQVKKEAEAEGLDRVFIDAGAEWRESGCSMCLGMNGDLVPKGQYSVSTSNRNFEGPPGRRCPHAARESVDGGRECCTRPGHRSTGVAGMKAVQLLRSKTVVLPASNIDTDQIIPARFLTTTTRDGPGRIAVRRLALRRRGRVAPGLRPQSPRSPGLPNPGRRTQLRLRLIARACAVGTVGLRDPGGRQHRDRGHFPQQLAEERFSARGRR